MMTLSIVHVLPLLLSSGLLFACATPPIDAEQMDSASRSNSVDTNERIEPLPEAIALSVKTALREDIGGVELTIGRYSRETWSDGCLGLGGPAEACLAALTEGWQVEIIDAGNQSYFYRTDFDGNQVRLSTLENNLPPSLRDRIFQTITEQENANLEDLSVISAEPKFWDGCYGIPPVDGVCPEVGILGWRTEVTDNNQVWVYHSGNSGDAILLKE